MGRERRFLRGARHRANIAEPLEVCEQRTLLTAISPDVQTMPAIEHSRLVLYSDVISTWRVGVIQGVYSTVTTDGGRLFESFSGSSSDLPSEANSVRVRYENLSEDRPWDVELRFRDADSYASDAIFKIGVGRVYQVSAQWSANDPWSAPQPVVYSPAGTAEIRVRDAGSFAASGFTVIPPMPTIIDDPLSPRPTWWGGPQNLGPKVLLRKMTGWTVEITDRTSGALVAKFSRDVDGMSGVMSQPLDNLDLDPGRYSARVQTISFMATDASGQNYNAAGRTEISDWSKPVNLTIWPSASGDPEQDSQLTTWPAAVATPQWNDLRNDAYYDIEYTQLSSTYGPPPDPFLIPHQRLQTGLWSNRLGVATYGVKIREVAIQGQTVVRSAWSETLTTTIAARSNAAWRAACPWTLDPRLNPANRLIVTDPIDEQDRLLLAGSGESVQSDDDVVLADPSDDGALESGTVAPAEPDSEHGLMFNQPVASSCSLIQFEDTQLSDRDELDWRDSWTAVPVKPASRRTDEPAPVAREWMSSILSDTEPTDSEVTISELAWSDLAQDGYLFLDLQLSEFEPATLPQIDDSDTDSPSAITEERHALIEVEAVQDVRIVHQRRVVQRTTAQSGLPIRQVGHTIPE